MNRILLHKSYAKSGKRPNNLTFKHFLKHLLKKMSIYDNTRYGTIFSYNDNFEIS